MHLSAEHWNVQHIIKIYTGDDHWSMIVSAQDSTHWTLSTPVAGTDLSRAEWMPFFIMQVSLLLTQIQLHSWSWLQISAYSCISSTYSMFQGLNETKSQHVIFLTAPEACSSLVETRKEWVWPVLSEARISVGWNVQSFMSSISSQQNVSVITSLFSGFFKMQNYTITLKLKEREIKMFNLKV